MTTFTVSFDTNTAFVAFSDASCNKPSIDGLDKAEAERLAILDHEALAGNIVEVEWLHDDEGNDYHASKENPFLVKVLKAYDGDILEYCDDHLDPRYDVILIDGKGKVPPDTSVWTFGRSYWVKPTTTL